MLLLTSCDGFILQCTYIVFSELYTCFAVFIASDSETSVTAVQGLHLDERNNNDVVSLAAIQTRNIDLMPNNIGSFFPNIEAVEFMDGSTSSISAENLQQFPNLRSLNLYGLNLISLSSDLFTYNPDLEWLDVQVNQIELVGLNLLDNLPKLTTARFSRNVCINMNANTRQEVEALQLELRLRCSFLDCPDECRATILELRTRLEKSRENILDQKRKITQLNALITEHEKKQFNDIANKLS